MTDEAGVASGHDERAAVFRVSARRPPLKIAQILAADLRRQILGGELVVDQQLPREAELTAAFEVSRETLREALRILESQSLLEVRRGRGGGAVIRRPGLAAVSRYVALLLQLRRTTLAHLEEARLVIEPHAAEQLALRCGQEGLDHVAALHENTRAAEGDPLAFATAVAAFDQAVTDLAGNRSIAVFTGVLRDIYAGQVYAVVGTPDLASAERAARRVVASQGELLRAVRARDGARASQAWSDYLVSTSRLQVSRSRSRQVIDVVPLWRAQSGSVGSGGSVGGGGSMGSGPPQRMAMAVATEIRARIAEGRLADGARLSSLADLAKEFGISRPTLREALRILETECLIELRTGDRSGPRIRHPSTKVAAQLAGTALEARQTTLADFFRAMTVIEPAMMELAASRIDQESLATLCTLRDELGSCTRDMPRFADIWGRGSALAFTATGNPALTVIAEILQWVRLGTGAALTTGVDEIWVATAQDNVRLFEEVVAALVAGDPARSRAAWAACLETNAPFIESSELARRRMTSEPFPSPAPTGVVR
ncbi:DNA-binding transcriptional regulator, FadR family [Parafrankia irregularis]|uniref:DNA-binding transcriptional regulator, FadR family n=1 Tax=Parafrankia irregularis TaxID=795642 RepID=A0A0S4R001_9ACTN|nr:MULTISPECIES: GntR family transcriptional regulator [Parafrankia]MBE3203490.1 FadR family transcriptional regulator [Parafrankia sp. CH37]CUU60150.1 DNA-binding transcriptional regulator, FadR family [Parafrankia irregularis]